MRFESHVRKNCSVNNYYSFVALSKGCMMNFSGRMGRG